MIASHAGFVTTWAERVPSTPLCDVPWQGRVVVLSSGHVNFCCSSDAFVGNVNDEPLEAIWRGETMQRIRASLSSHEFPPECMSNSCPIWRGDKSTFLHTRMLGDASPPETARRAKVRDGLRNTRLQVAPARLRRGDVAKVTLLFDSTDPGFEADVFLALTSPSGEMRFLPESTDYPLPLALRQYVPTGQREIELVNLPGRAAAAGTWTLCAALIVGDTNPSSPANCYWQGRTTVVVDPE